MGVPCRPANCNKKSSIPFNRNRHEKAKGLRPKDKAKAIPFNVAQDMCLCPTQNCKTKSKLFQNNQISLNESQTIPSYSDYCGV